MRAEASANSFAQADTLNANQNPSGAQNRSRWIRNAGPQNLTAIKSPIDKPRMPLVVQLANKDNQPRVPIKKSTYHSFLDVRFYRRRQPNAVRVVRTRHDSRRVLGISGDARRLDNRVGKKVSRDRCLHGPWVPPYVAKDYILGFIDDNWGWGRNSLDVSRLNSEFLTMTV
ncbi:hypothetical protein VCV18_001315 [Metarhizium anisopliae]